jgi:DNA polymerase I-like protein with 3'-5' exonuclease and polymerase domains
VDKANDIIVNVMMEMKDITEKLHKIFPPIITPRTSIKTGKKLKDKIEEFNISSRQQIAKRLQQKGIKLKEKTEKGQLIINEKILAEIDTPESNLINRYLLLQKRQSQVESWLKLVTKEGRVHGRVRTNGTVTGRMTHSTPNMAQVPAVNVPFGRECRECWTVDEGNVLVGADASGLELRMLAHYMNDEEYTYEVLSGDIHTANQKAAGLQTRDQAKTFIYAFLYGAGPAKIGQIVGGSYDKGRELIDEFLDNTPALKKLRKSISDIAETGTLKGLDGRRLTVRSKHSSLNTLLQGAGAIVMKQALVILDEALKKHNLPYKFVANVHDEWQIEVPEWAAKAVGYQAVYAIREAGKVLDLNCPLDGEFKIGRNWAETH